MKAVTREKFTKWFNSDWRPQRQAHKVFKRLKVGPRVIAGTRYGKLVALRQAEKKHPRSLMGIAYYWDCQCECGNVRTILEGKLAAGWCTACEACEIGEPEFYYRRDKTKELRKFEAAKFRCTNPKCRQWVDYGGRGILFKFDTFRQFYEHLGACPPGKTLDRFPDYNGNYEEGNVRWATREEQMQNTRATKFRPKDIVFIRRAGAAGIAGKTLAKWFGVSYGSIRDVQLGKTWANIEDPARSNQ